MCEGLPLRRTKLGRSFDNAGMELPGLLVPVGIVGITTTVCRRCQQRRISQQRRSMPQSGIRELLFIEQTLQRENGIDDVNFCCLLGVIHEPGKSVSHDHLGCLSKHVTVSPILSGPGIEAVRRGAEASRNKTNQTNKQKIINCLK